MKVLVPLDGSDASMQAMERGLALIEGCGPQVTLLCVRAKGFDDVDADRREIFEEDPDDEIFASDDEAEGMLADAAVRCKDIGLDVDSNVIVGNFEKVILEESGSYDLVIMHELGNEPFKEKLRMSKAEALVRALQCPVLLA